MGMTIEPIVGKYTIMYMLYCIKQSYEQYTLLDEITISYKNMRTSFIHNLTTVN